MAVQQPPDLAGTHLNIARVAALLAIVSAGALASARLGFSLLAATPSLMWILAAVAGATVILGAYRRHPAVVARRRATAAYMHARRDVTRAETALVEVQQLLPQLDAERASQVQAIMAEREAASRHRDAALEQARNTLQQALAAIQQERNHQSNTQQARESKRLRALADDYVNRALRNAVIVRNPPSLIDAKIAKHLADSGFRTAADFVGYRTASGYGRYDRTFLRRFPGDNGTYVEQVGEKRAASLVKWRDKIKASAEKQAPTSLTAQQRQEVARELQQHLQQLASREHQAKQLARDATVKAKAVEQSAQADLDRKQRQIDDDFHGKRANADRRVTGARSALTAAQQTAEQQRRAFDANAMINGRRFLLATLGLPGGT